VWLFVNNTVLCVGIERSRVWRLLDDVAVFLRVKSAMKSTMPFVDRGDIEKVQLRGADTWSWGEGCVCGDFFVAKDSSLCTGSACCTCAWM